MKNILSLLTENMNNKEKLPKLLNLPQPADKLGKRQLPLVVDESLTVMHLFVIIVQQLEIDLVIH